MIRRPLPYCISSACYLSAWPTVAADSETGAELVTGLSNTGLGMFIIAIAAALLTTLLLRASATQFARITTSRIGRRRIQRILQAKTADVLEDFILPGAYGGLTNIEFAILSSGGIICIQTKHLNGIVSGEPDEPQWTSIDGAQRRKFLNPMIQNQGRAKALQKIVPNVAIANLVVFTGSIQFASQLASNVIHVKDLASYVAEIDFDAGKVEDWGAEWKSVKTAALTDEETRKDFRAQLSFS